MANTIITKDGKIKTAVSYSWCSEEGSLLKTTMSRGWRLANPLRSSHRWVYANGTDAMAHEMGSRSLKIRAIIRSRIQMLILKNWNWNPRGPCSTRHQRADVETVRRRRWMDKECEMDAQRMLGRLFEEESTPTCGNMGGPEVSNKLVYCMAPAPLIPRA